MVAWNDWYFFFILQAYFTKKIEGKQLDFPNFYILELYVSLHPTCLGYQKLDVFIYLMDPCLYVVWIEKSEKVFFLNY